MQVAEHLPTIEQALAGLYAVAERLIGARRGRPGDDLVRVLVHAEEDGDRLSRAELRNVVVTVLFAGRDTTKHQFANALALFASDPAAWELLAARPDLVPRAVDEVMRVATRQPHRHPGHGRTRTWRSRPAAA
ncbi:MAG: hypothetical protein H0U21_05480 [Acidimicrobiia bacterium]|nr:hypothetical protein [Acidimicrobiia bacterium]